MTDALAAQRPTWQSPLPEGPASSLEAACTCSSTNPPRLHSGLGERCPSPGVDAAEGVGDPLEYLRHTPRQAMRRCTRGDTILG